MLRFVDVTSGVTPTVINEFQIFHTTGNYKGPLFPLQTRRSLPRVLLYSMRRREPNSYDQPNSRLTSLEMTGLEHRRS